MESVTLVFTASQFFLSRLIRWITGGRTSHVMIEYPSALWGNRWAAEATVGGTRMIRADRVNHHVVAVYECRFNAQDALQAISGYIGDTGFDYPGLVSLAVPKLVWRWFRKKVRNPIHNNPGMFCSELVATMLMAAKLPGTENWIAEEITPEDILKYCENTPSWFNRLNIS